MNLVNGTTLQAGMTMGFDRKRREQIVVAVKGTWSFEDGIDGDAVFAAEQEPLLETDILGLDPAPDAPILENDFAPLKPRCDVIALADAHAPPGQRASRVDVGLRLGDWSKTFCVHGSRIWLASGTDWRVSDPRPFELMPITYDTAWGGTDPDPDNPERTKLCEENPSGIGYYPYRDDLSGLALPVTSTTPAPVADRDGPHRPMALGPIGRHWLSRRRFAGTYDAAWTDDVAPFLPDDFDPLFYQSAPPDQQVAHPRGGEILELAGLTPAGRCRTRLPRGRVTVTFRRKVGPLTHKIAVLDTVVVLARQRRFCLTWRTRISCKRDIHEFAEILVGAEAAVPA